MCSLHWRLSIRDTMSSGCVKMKYHKLEQIPASLSHKNALMIIFLQILMEKQGKAKCRRLQGMEWSLHLLVHTCTYFHTSINCGHGTAYEYISCAKTN